MDIYGGDWWLFERSLQHFIKTNMIVKSIYVKIRTLVKIIIWIRGIKNNKRKEIKEKYGKRW